jgi:hypothetical protein
VPAVVCVPAGVVRVPAFVVTGMAAVVGVVVGGRGSPCDASLLAGPIGPTARPSPRPATRTAASTPRNTTSRTGVLMR